MKKLVIALGGNALGKTPEEQLNLVKATAKTIVDLVEEGYNVIDVYKRQGVSTGKKNETGYQGHRPSDYLFRQCK